MLWIVGKVWLYRTEILLAVALLQKLRKTAAEIAREYVRDLIRTKLQRSLLVVGGQIALFVGLACLNRVYPGPLSRLVASIALWAVTVYNLGELILVTIPQLAALRRTLKSAKGYAMKYFLEVSLATELTRLNVLFLALCLLLGVSSRTWIGSSFSYTKPWKEFARISHSKERRAK